MASFGVGPHWLPSTSNSIFDIIAPANYADAAALAVIATASVAYTLRKYTWDRPDPYEYIWYERPQANGAKGNAARVTRNIAQRLEELVGRLRPATTRPQADLVVGPASRHILGFSVWNRRRVREPASTRASSALWPRGPLRRSVGL
jgi:hypothetical protein